LCPTLFEKFQQKMGYEGLLYHEKVLFSFL